MMSGKTPAHLGPRFIMGNGVTLRRLERDDVDHVRRWMDDPEMRTLVGATNAMSEDEAEKWFETIETDPSRMWYAIVIDEDDSVVGEAGLLRLVPEWRTTDMTIIVGERSQWRKGYGSEAGRLLLDLAFNYLGLHRVAIGVVGFNEAALAFWKKLGFTKEGVQRDGYVHDGAFHDFVMMSILEDDWRAGQAGSGQAGAGDAEGAA